jgi:phosphatidylglycerol:prolipoprotein diacylglycerol transferase
MQQILFHLPIFNPFAWEWTSLPIYGYGMMLFLAFFFCTWMASWLAKKQGIRSENIQDLGIWIFVCGILGARITYMIQYHVPWSDIYKIWDGGLVFYGSAIGGVVGYFGAWYFILRKYQISTWKMADIIAPCGALGLCLGRFGCLLNGCCFGNVACPDCPAISFPLPTDPRYKMVMYGYQTAAGFTVGQDDRFVARVEPGSPAARAGLRDGDEIVEIDGVNITPSSYLGAFGAWPRGKNDLLLKVRHRDGAVEQLPAFVPWTIGLHPTQIYESISMALLFLLLLAVFPYRRHDGEVMVLFMLAYAIHRFLNEMLRVDTEPVALGMTLSQNISVLVFVGGLVMLAWLWLKTPRLAPAPP